MGVPPKKSLDGGNVHGKSQSKIWMMKKGVAIYYHIFQETSIPMTDPAGAAIYGAPWIPSIYSTPFMAVYPIILYRYICIYDDICIYYVLYIYTSTMDPSWDMGTIIDHRIFQRQFPQKILKAWTGMMESACGPGFLSQ